MSTKDGVSLTNPGMTEGRYNELAKKYGFQWRNKENPRQIDPGEIEFLSGRMSEDELRHAQLAVINEQHNVVVYQVVLDRFYNGNPENDVPLYAYEDQWSKEIAPTMVDPFRFDDIPARYDLNRLWGGDIEGFIEKVPYIQELGANYVWLSPVFDNTNGFSIGTEHYKTSYHGYWIRDFYRIDEHLTNKDDPYGPTLMQRTIEAAHKHGIRLMMDAVPNHTGPIDGAERGMVYKNGEPFVDYANDIKGYFHHNPPIETCSGWEPYNEESFQNCMLANLGDWDQSKPEVRDYLLDGHKWLFGLGFDGVRIDAVPHFPWDFSIELRQTFQDVNPDVLLVGEFFMGDGTRAAAQQRYEEATGVPTFDFYLRHNHIMGAFGSPSAVLAMPEGTGQINLGNYIAAKVKEYPTGFSWRTFVDNHDLPRFLNKNLPSDPNALAEWNLYGRDLLNEAVKMQFCLPGVPFVYYGTEDYLYDPEGRDGFYGNGGDPFNRGVKPWPADYKERPGFKFMQTATAFRRANPALRFGEAKMVAVEKFSLGFTREFEGNKVFYLHIREGSGSSKAALSKRLSGIKVDFPDGRYKDPFTHIKYEVKAGRMKMINGVYMDPVWGRERVVKNGELMPEQLQAQDLNKIEDKDDSDKTPAEGLPPSVYTNKNGRQYIIDEMGRLVMPAGGYVEALSKKTYISDLDGLNKLLGGDQQTCAQPVDQLPDGEFVSFSGQKFIIKDGGPELPDGEYTATRGAKFVKNGSAIEFERPYLTIVFAVDK